MLLLIDADDRLVGEIEYDPITEYLAGFELSYLAFRTSRTAFSGIYTLGL
jgi:hypothetical protein